MKIPLVLAFLAIAACDKHRTEVAPEVSLSATTAATTPATTATPATPPAPTNAPGGPVTCTAAAEKFNELSIAEAKTLGREWPPAKGARKMEGFVKDCQDGKKKGEFSDAELQCVMAATSVDGATKCLKR